MVNHTEKLIPGFNKLFSPQSSTQLSKLFVMLSSIYVKTRMRGIPWWSSGQGSTLPLQGAWVRSLVGELRSCKLRGKAKKKKKKKNQSEKKCRESKSTQRGGMRGHIPLLRPLNCRQGDYLGRHEISQIIKIWPLCPNDVHHLPSPKLLFSPLQASLQLFHWSMTAAFANLSYLVPDVSLLRKQGTSCDSELM